MEIELLLYIMKLLRLRVSALCIMNSFFSGNELEIARNTFNSIMLVSDIII